MFHKIISRKDFADLIKDNMTIMIGGFLGCGTPETLVDVILEKGSKNLTIICNDTSFTDKGLGRLIAAKQVARVITSHIGTNAETGKQMVDGTLKVDLVPQGTLVERIRCAGAGLGGVLTPTGVGTMVEEGKQKLTVEGIDYLLELPLRAELALIGGSIVDKAGNVVYNGTTRNFNPIMAMAADVVVVEAQKLVEIGEIQPELVMTPSPLVTHIFAPAKS
ncbi:MAG: branched-chain amino acid dehydrogenase [Candidatus Riflebacteria bacterium HGW-Riflebacteria-1]|jgi:acetate CoA/acetoacetate CoA-transferase alpha subunit|nr:MAG: branched-chain amino acid dehydrogenase [Candidatus Riflebacteria bacterium HGW-Riflebacteria-1]